MGRMMCQMRLNGPAPSSHALSSKSSGTLRKPTSRKMKLVPMCIHMVMAQTHQMAVD